MKSLDQLMREQGVGKYSDQQMFAPMGSVAEGVGPQNPLKEAHPDMGVDRYVVMNFATTPETAVRFLKEKGWEVEHQGGWNFSIKKPGETDWYQLDPEGMDLGDLGDIWGDVATGLGAGVGIGAGAVGGMPGAMAGGALGGAAVEGLKQVAGSALGLDPTIGERVKGMGAEAALGAAGPVIGKIGGKIGEKLLPQTLTRRLMGMGDDELLEAAAKRGVKAPGAGRRSMMDQSDELLNIPPAATGAADDLARAAKPLPAKPLPAKASPAIVASTPDDMAVRSMDDVTGKPQFPVTGRAPGQEVLKLSLDEGPLQSKLSAYIEGVKKGKIPYDSELIEGIYDVAVKGGKPIRDSLAEDLFLALHGHHKPGLSAFEVVKGNAPDFWDDLLRGLKAKHVRGGRKKIAEFSLKRTELEAMLDDFYTKKPDAVTPASMWKKLQEFMGSSDPAHKVRRGEAADILALLKGRKPGAQAASAPSIPKPARTEPLRGPPGDPWERTPVGPPQGPVAPVAQPGPIPTPKEGASLADVGKTLSGKTQLDSAARDRIVQETLGRQPISKIRETLSNMADAPVTSRARRNEGYPVDLNWLQTTIDVGGKVVGKLGRALLRDKTPLERIAQAKETPNWLRGKMNVALDYFTNGEVDKFKAALYSLLSHPAARKALEKEAGGD